MGKVQMVTSSKMVIFTFFIFIFFLNFSCKKITASLESDDSLKIYAYFKVDEKPVILHKELPVYPTEAIQDSLQGIVVVTIVIKPDSSVAVLEVFRGLHALLDSAAVDAARLCSFKPAVHKGRFVNCSMFLPFHFKLSDLSTH